MTDRTIQKRQAANTRPACPKCGKDMKRSYEHSLNQKTGKKQYKANGWECEACNIKVWDKKEIV